MQKKNLMKMTELQKIFIKAVEENAIVDFLEGKIEIPPENQIRPMENIDAPIDLTKIMPDTFYALFKTKPKYHFEKILHDAIEKMTYGTSFDFECAMRVFFTQLIFERFKKSPFILEKEDLIARISERLKTLDSDYPRIAEIERIVRTMKEKYGIQL